jgi:hypothetical protein
LGGFKFVLFWHGAQACQKLGGERWCIFYFFASAADFAEAEGTECCLLIEASMEQPWKSQQSGQAGPFFRTRRLCLARIVHLEFQTSKQQTALVFFLCTFNKVGLSTVTKRELVNQAMF